MIIQWEMTAETALEFFRRVKELKEDTKDARMEILHQLAEEGLMKSVIATDRTLEQIIQDKKKQYGNVLDLTGGKDEAASE